MAKRPLPTPEEVRQLLDYNSETGNLTWKERESPAKWNARFAGKPAFTAKANGYNQGHVMWRLCRAHRVVWALHYGEWPCGQIDHINGIRTDNRIENLRVVDATDNARNMGISRRNSSGSLGVSWIESRKSWRCRIRTASREKHIGYFKDFGDAVEARKAAEMIMGYHPNHGATRG